VLVVLLPEYLPVTAAADIHSRRVSIAEDSALCGCWRFLVEIDDQLSALQKIFESVVMFLINNRNFALGFCYPETYY
jgi:hypothetical protein